MERDLFWSAFDKQGWGRPDSSDSHISFTWQILWKEIQHFVVYQPEAKLVLTYAFNRNTMEEEDVGKVR